MLPYARPATFVPASFLPHNKRGMQPIEEAVAAIRGGDVHSLRQVLRDHPHVANARVDGKRTLLHVLTDWPGNLPRSAEMIAALVEVGADVNAPFIGPHAETPLHWAASNDDVISAAALLEHGAGIEATGSVIDGGTPLSDAVAFGQWKAARYLIERGASANLWQSAALGLMDRVEDAFRKSPAPSPDQITNAFWCACHGGQRQTAEYLLQRGADANWIGHNGLTPLEAAKRSGATGIVDWLQSLA